MLMCTVRAPWLLPQLKQTVVGTRPVTGSTWGQAKQQDSCRILAQTNACSPHAASELATHQRKAVLQVVVTTLLRMSSHTQPHLTLSTCGCVDGRDASCA